MAVSEVLALHQRWADERFFAGAEARGRRPKPLGFVRWKGPWRLDVFGYWYRAFLTPTGRRAYHFGPVVRR